jgi:membrane-associated protease RseP (regulator of RpoE activity)
MRIRAAIVLTLYLVASLAANAGPSPGSDSRGAKPPDEAGERPWHGFERYLPPSGRLGVQVQDMTPELREFLRAPRERGVLVVRVNPGSPAEEVGLRVGDVIVAAGGESVVETADLVRVVHRAEKAARLALEVVRQGKPVALEPVLAGEPWSMKWLEERAPEFRRQLEERLRDLEARLRALEEQLRGALKPDELDTSARPTGRARGIPSRAWRSPDASPTVPRLRAAWWASSIGRGRFRWSEFGWPSSRRSCATTSARA